MNLAFCLFNYFPYGGLQRDFHRIAKECIQRGHSIDVYTMRWESEKDPSLNLILLPPKGIQNHTQRKNFHHQLQKKLQEKKYDLIIGFNKMPGLDLYYAADTCYQAKAHKHHGMWYRLLPRYKHSVEFEEAVFSNNSSTEILLLSKQQREDYIHYYNTPRERLHLLPPGISKDRIAPLNAHEIRVKLRHEFNLSSDHFLLLMIGSGFKTKGLDRILLGIASLPELLRKRTILFVLGKDNPNKFQRLANKLGIQQQVLFLGGKDDVPRFLLAADLLVHPAYNENTGTVLLEALASGLPVLTTDNCGYAEYVTKAQAGIVLKSPFEQNQFNQALIDMLSSSQQATWKENALAFTKHADIYNLIQHAVDVIDSLGTQRQRAKICN